MESRAKEIKSSQSNWQSISMDQHSIKNQLLIRVLGSTDLISSSFKLNINAEIAGYKFLSLVPIIADKNSIRENRLGRYKTVIKSSIPMTFLLFDRFYNFLC